MNAAGHDLGAADQVALGGTDVTISRIGFGSAPLGGLFEAVDEAQATAAVSSALDAGISYFDSAPHYGWGLAEQRLGVALSGADPRPRIGTKIGYGLRPSNKPPHAFVGAPPLEPFVDWTAAGVERSFYASLERLRVDRVDVLYLHDPNNRDDFDEMIKVGAVMARRWQAEGLVGAVGAGMNETDDTLELLKRLELDCVLIAGRVSLLDQSAVSELLPYCQEHNVGVIVGGVFNSGILAAPETTPNFDYGPASGEIRMRTVAIRRICETHDVPLVAAALQYPFRHSAVTAVIPGMRSPQEVEDDLRLFACDIPEALWYELEKAELIPGA